MPRKARQHIIAPNQIYHIVARGNNERRIFRSSRDYKKYINILKETKTNFPFYLYCYSLMPNHYHLQIEIVEPNLSKIMHRINFLYAIYFKKRYQTSGHLFQDRFYSSPIERENYLWEAARYIDLNPVRASLVKNPEDWRWGSFQYYFQNKNPENSIDQERFLRFGGNSLEEAKREYIKFVRAAVKTEKIPSFVTPTML